MSTQHTATPHRPRRIGIVSTKGGTGKTTSAVNLAAGYHALGYRTLAICCDPQQSLLSYSERAAAAGTPLPFTVISLPVADIHKRLDQLAASFDCVILDAPPGAAAIIRSVILSAGIIIVPVAPTGLDLDRLRPTFEILAELEHTHPVQVGVLLTKVRAGTRAARGARELLADQGYPLLKTEIPLAELHAAAFGSPPADIGRYADVITELEEAAE
jgi:chromosome partitioning protein